MHFFVLNLDILQIFAFILQIFVLISGFFMVWNKKNAKRRDFGSFCSQNHVFLHNSKFSLNQYETASGRYDFLLTV
jgi:hypothetical protein